MANFDVDVFFTVDNTVVTRPDCETARIVVGDTLTFHCPTGELEIRWQENVFDQEVTSNDQPATVVTAGPFRGACSVVLPGGKPLLWEGGALTGKSWEEPRPPDTPQTHQFTITPKPGGTFSLTPPFIEECRKGDAVIFSAPGATLQIRWTNNPFTRVEYIPAVVRAPGSFEGICTFTAVDGTVTEGTVAGQLGLPLPGNLGKTEHGDETIS